MTQDYQAVMNSEYFILESTRNKNISANDILLLVL